MMVSMSSVNISPDGASGTPWSGHVVYQYCEMTFSAPRCFTRSWFRM